MAISLLGDEALSSWLSPIKIIGRSTVFGNSLTRLSLEVLEADEDEANMFC